MLTTKIFRGKCVGGYIYAHRSACGKLAQRLQIAIDQADGIAEDFDWNVAKIEQKGNHVSLLFYCDFFGVAFPELHRSCRVNLITKSTKKTNYFASANRPVLHRKELLLDPDHPRQKEYACLTRELVRLGLLRDSHKVGYREQWYERLTRAGFTLFGHKLITKQTEDNATKT